MLAATEITDRLFDARYGTETIAEATLASLTGVVGDTEHAEPYVATRVLALHKQLRTLDLPPGQVLVDFGSGKGRVLMVAAPFSFRAVRGIEFSAALCDVAGMNVERFRRRSGSTVEIGLCMPMPVPHPGRRERGVPLQCVR
jgi:hypothetical protein